MSLNKYMHPRNIYKTPPDFEQLAIMFEDFRNITKMNLNGKIVIDFKDENVLRTLTKCLLMKDFNIEIAFPPHQLVPTLPLRLNYIHWIEDIMKTFNFNNVNGIDIGCGASCIYPMLAVQQNQSWQMFATELNQESIAFAQSNIERNGFSDRIKIITDCSESGPFSCLFEPNVDLPPIDFTMCNPPFFSDEHNFDNSDCNITENQLTKFKNRTGKRKAANNAQTGIKCELMTEGGEVEFVRKMIHDSQKLWNRIAVFTTMLGHKTSENQILNELKMNKITNFCNVEFCQGKTTRWAIAWTFRNDLLLRTVPIIGQVKVKSPVKFCPSDVSSMNDAIAQLKIILGDLNNASITNQSDDDETTSFYFIAQINSWSNQRRKRREAIRNQALNDSEKNDVDQDEEISGAKEKRRKLDLGYKALLIQESSSPPTPPVLHIKIAANVIEEENDKSSIYIELQYLNGNAGISGVHELLQFIRNKWKIN